MSEENPLEDLYVDKTSINKERLSKALSGLIGIDQDTGDPVTLPEYSELTQSQKLYAYLLYRRATFELGHVAENEMGIQTPELQSETGVPEGTVRRVLSGSQLIENDRSKGGYFVPDFAISGVIDELENN